MATAVQTLLQPPPPVAWIWGFLKEELAPYPGRGALVARMTIAATLVMIVCMTFRIPFAFQGAIYALLISRESPRATTAIRDQHSDCYSYRGGLSSRFGAGCY